MAKKKVNLEESEDVFLTDDVLDYSVTEVVDKFKVTLPQELKMIKDKENDWTKKSTIALKEEFYELENLVVGMHVDFIKEVFESLGGRSRKDAPFGFKWMDTLKESFEIHDKRVMEFLKSENKAESKIDKSEVDSTKKRIEFRNTVSKNHAKYKKVIKKIPFEDDGGSDILLDLHKQTAVIGIALKDAVENKYPQMKKYLDKRLGVKK